jgi:uncharacterized protein (TIGR02246 family)
MWRHVWSIVLFSILVVPRGSRAATDSAARAEIQNLVKSFVKATNEGDVDAIMDMYSHEPEVASLGYGGIARDRDAIRADSEQLVGKAGKVRVAVGPVEVVSLGTAHALAFVSGVVFSPVLAESAVHVAPVSVALTFVFERSSGRWKIVHQHASARR